MELKVDHFATNESIQEAVTENLKDIPARVMEKLENRAKSCLECNGWL